jgi:serine-type D-Ala-D-Ala carboxypeptidase/endopeptidase (penicillin-binding protein 4)
VRPLWRTLSGSLVAVLLVVGCSSNGGDEPGDDPAALAPGEQVQDVEDDADGTDEDGDPEAEDRSTPTEDPDAGDGDAAAGEPPPPPPSRTALVAELQGLVDEAVAQSGEATLSVLVLDEHGRELVAHQPDVPVLPASTTKIVTAAAALLTLGEDRSLLTRAEVTGPIEAGGVVTGDLLLVGGGDPSLATDEYIRWIYPARPATRLSDLADQIVASGVRRITGDLVGVSEGFPGDRLPTGWPDEYFATLDARYIDGLTVDASLRTIVTFPEGPAGPVEPTDGADGEGADVEGEAAEDGEAAEGAAVEGEAAEGAVEGEAAEGAAVEGEATEGAAVEDEAAEGTATEDAADDLAGDDPDDAAGADDGTPLGPDDELPEPPDLDALEAELGPPRVIVDHTPDPPLHAASELARMLQDRGIVLDGEVRSGPPVADPLGRVARVASPTIEDMLRFAVSRSDNHMSDQLFRVVGRTRTGEGSWRESDRAIRQVLDRLGVAHDDARFADGSGLSRDSRVTARLLIDLDRAMQTTRHRARWMDLMAVTGERGTLSERLVGTSGAGRFYGKTGTLNDVLGLVGTVVDDSSRAYHLAVVINDAPFGQRGVARTLQDRLILRLVADLDARAEPDPAAGEPADEPADEPTDEPGGEPADEPADEPEAAALDLGAGVLLGLGS